MDNGKSENSTNNQNGIVQGDRNIITHNFNQNLSKPDFFEPNLEQLDAANFILPKSEIISELIEIIHTHKLIVLNGSLDIDKVSIARHLAWNFCQTLQQQVNNITVKEWYRSSEPQNINIALQKTTSTTVFLLIGLVPENISYDFSKIQQAASLYKHYVIATTDIPFSAWKQTDSSRIFWHELYADNLYDLDTLIKELKIKLIAAQISSLDADLSMIASNLKTPDNVAYFVQLLAAEYLTTQSDKKELKKSTIIRLSDITQNKYELLSYWYFNILSCCEQILVLNLSYFDGLFDHQLFAILERVIDEVWQQREPSIYLPDYLDLDNLSNFFSFVGIRDGSKKIESRLPQQRLMLFDIAWQSYRRGILAILPVIIELVKESVERISFQQNLYDSSLQRELFSPPIKRQRLRQTLSETISDIGLIDSSELIETLVELSAHKNIAVQAVAASAMARWYYYEQEQKLLDTISKLQNSQYTKRSDNKSTDSQANILATIALTISCVIEYDYPKEISKNFYDLLENLSNHASIVVRDRFFYQILPRLVPLYLLQLKDILRNLLRDTYSIKIIVKRLVSAYKTKPEEVLSILDLWYKDYINNRLSQDKANNQISQEEALLQTIALTYKNIRLSTLVQHGETDLKFLQEINESINNTISFNPYIEDVPPQQNSTLNINRDSEQQILSPNDDISELQTTSKEILGSSKTNESLPQNNEDLQMPANNNVNLGEQQANPQAIPTLDINVNSSKNLIIRLQENLSRLISKNIGLIGLLSLSLMGLLILGIFVWRNPQNQASNQPSIETSSSDSNSNSVTPSPQGSFIPNFQRTENIVRMGWIILGTTNSSRRGVLTGNSLTQNRQLLTIEPPVVPANGSVVTITKRVNLRINRPQRPRFNAEEQPQVGILNPGEKVIIVKTESFVESTNSSITKVWAEVGKQAR